jgi:hypothetical protein
MTINKKKAEEEVDAYRMTRIKFKDYLLSLSANNFNKSALGNKIKG